MELHYKIIGILLILLAFAHAFFPKYFKWKEQLNTLSLINRQMMEFHTFFIALTIFLMGTLCLSSTHELIHTTLGKKISFGFGLFWFFRLLIQFWGYSSKNWKGKRLETIIHIIFSVLWSYLSFVFLNVYFTS